MAARRDEQASDTDLQDPGMDPRTWVQEHGDFLFRFALRAVRHRQAAEDLVQETLLAAWRGRHEFVGLAAERTWLTAILKRKVVDWLRQRLRERVQANWSETDDVTARLFTRRGEWKIRPGRWDWSATGGSMERAEFWAVLRECLGKLPPRLSDVFSLRYLDETAGEEVCRELGLTPSNLWVMLHRARLRMWWCLSRNWFGEETQGGGSET